MSTFTEINPTDITDNPFKLIGTDWMLITAGNEVKVNAMTASWGGFGVMWGKNTATIVIRPQRYTKEFVDSCGTFSLAFFDESYRKTLGYFGKVSGRDEDKIKHENLSVSFTEATPYFNEAKLVVICKKLFAQPYTEDSFLDKTVLEKWYPERDLHTLYIAEVIKVLKK